MVYHLQLQSPPILPPLCQLFDQAAEEEQRPLHERAVPAAGVLQVRQQLLTTVPFTHQHSSTAVA